MPTTQSGATCDDSSFHIAFCVDNHYFRSMGAVIASIIAHNPARHFTFHVFAFSVTPDQARRLKTLEHNPHIRVVTHVVDPRLFDDFSAMIEKSYYSLSTFTRLIIPAALKDVTDRVLYLDADMLCVGSVDELASTELDDTIALVVPDVGWTTNGSPDGRYSTLNLKTRQYFNAGVIYINIPAWEANKVGEQAILTLLNDSRKLTFNDQDALNIVLDGKARYVPVKWNYIYSMIVDLKRGKLTMDSVGDAVFIHFAGLIKPWNDWSGHHARELFLKYHKLSAWSDVDLDPVPLNHKEMRIHARSLFKRGMRRQGASWYLAHLAAIVRKKLKK
jgi:UDP-glucose:(glucosyl)LPS alpha-1,3-glucosyltransferase